MSVDFHLKDYQKFPFVTEVLCLFLKELIESFIKLAPQTACTTKNETLVVKEKAVTIKLAVSSKKHFQAQLKILGSSFVLWVEVAEGED